MTKNVVGHWTEVNTTVDTRDGKRVGGFERVFKRLKSEMLPDLIIQVENRFSD